MDFHFKPTELALWSIACGVFGWLIKSHFSSGADVRKQHFSSAISNLRDQFGLVRDDLLVDAHAQSLSRIREEAAKIKSDIGRRRWDALNSCVSSYSGLTKNDIENRDHKATLGPGTNAVPAPNYA